jgi:hypothetical protein
VAFGKEDNPVMQHLCFTGLGEQPGQPFETGQSSLADSSPREAKGRQRRSETADSRAHIVHRVGAAQLNRHGIGAQLSCLAHNVKPDGVGAIVLASPALLHGPLSARNGSSTSTDGIFSYAIVAAASFITGTEAATPIRPASCEEFPEN